MNKILSIIFILLLFPTLILSIGSKNLIELVENNNLPAVKQAIQNGADVNVSDNLGFTPLHIAAWNGYTDITLCLLKNGANPNVISESGNTPLRFAPDNIKTLLKRYGAYDLPKPTPPSGIVYSPNIFLNKTDPPTYERTYKPTREIPYQAPIINEIVSNFTTNTVHISNNFYFYDYPKRSYDLLKTNGFVENAALYNWDKDGNNSLHKAAKIGNLDQVKTLINRGVNPHFQNINGDTALRFAVEEQHFEVTKYLIEEVGIDINHVNQSGTSAITLAALNNDSPMIQYLVQMGANPNTTATAFAIRTIDGISQETEISNWTPLMAAAQLGNNQAIETLLDARVNINSVDSDGWNALMFASQNKHTDTVEYLIKQGINYNIESKTKQTALSLAVDNNDQETIDVLKSVNASASSIPLLQFEETITEETNEIQVESYEYIE
ncbi:MAG: ankyrin repeat domain-containing protein [Brevinemataceae bacterium]